MIKPILLSALVLTSVQAYSAETLTLRMDKDGPITHIINETSKTIEAGQIRVKKTYVGSYDIDLRGILPEDQSYKKTTIQCSINTGSQELAGKQNVGCYQVNGSPIIRLQTRNNLGNPSSAAVSITVKW